MEAEIIALDHCCKDLLSVIDVIKELGDVVVLPTKDLVIMHVSIHKDNAGALILAETIPPSLPLGVNTTLSRLFGSMMKSIREPSNCSKLIQLSNWVISAQKACREPRLSIFENE
ncbi:hypothetical protein ACHAW6_000167 [Cyclotella cf. meneghiniana]